MTVGQLIKRLSTFESSLPVRVDNDQEIYNLECVDFSLDPDNMSNATIVYILTTGDAS